MPVTLEDKILVALQSRDYVLAENLIHKIKKEKKPNPNVNYFLGELALARGEETLAISHLDQYAKNNSNSVVKVVNLLSRYGAFGGVRNVLLAAIKTDPFNAELRLMLAKCYLDMGSLQEAAKAINEKNKFVGLKDNDTALIIRLCSAISATASSNAIFDEFLSNEFVSKVMAKTCVSATSDATSIINAVNTLLQYDAVEKAMNILKEVTQVSPKKSQFWIFLVRCYLDMGMNSDAVSALNQKKQLLGLSMEDRPLILRLQSGIMDGNCGADVHAFLADPYIRNIIEIEDTSVYGNFESLGDDCELGAVQNKLGLEPQGLFRWGAAPIEILNKLLNNGFEDFAKLEHCELKLLPYNNFSMYDFFEHKYGFHMHTFIAPDASNDASTVLAKYCARSQFLKRKLLEDLESAEKIFVYKAKEIEDAEIHALSQALRSYGPNRLLVIQEAAISDNKEKIQRVNDYILKGYIGKFDVSAKSNWHEWKVLLDLALCEFANTSVAQPEIH